MANRLAFGTLQCFAQLAAVRDLHSRGSERLECRFGLSRLRADAKREARTMDPPIIRVQIRIEDLQGGAWIEDEPFDRAVLGQPAPDRAQVGACKLPFH